MSLFVPSGLWGTWHHRRALALLTEAGVQALLGSKKNMKEHVHVFEVTCVTFVHFPVLRT